MKRTVGGLIVFGFIIAILLGALQLANWVPSAIQSGAFQRYASIEEVRARLNIPQVYAPVYYPPMVRWPPSLIGAQTKPYSAVVMEFAGKDRADLFVVATQTAKGHPPVEERIRMTLLRDKVPYPFKGRQAVLEVGICGNDVQCSRLSWDEGDYRIAVIMKSSPRDLVLMAESMIVR